MNSPPDRRRAARAALFLLSLAVAPVAAHADAAAGDAVAAFRRELPWLLADEPDLTISTGTVPLPKTIPAVELFFSTPLAFPVTASRWEDTVETAETPGALFVLADDLLGRTSAVEPALLDWRPPEPVPPSARESIRRLVSAMAAARPYLDRAIASVPAADRDAFADLFEWPAPGQPVKDELSSRKVKERIAAMASYRESDMRTAGGLVLMAVGEALDQLADTTFYVPKPLRFESPAGDIVIGGNGPDIYTAKDIENAAIIVDFGGRNTYVGPAGYAGPGEMRVVIDLGTSVDIRSGRRTGAAGASLFGIAAVALPNDTGVKRMTTSSWSQGATLGGVAACLVAGRGELTAGRYSQGAAVHGVAIFSAVRAGESSYACDGYGQGLGGLRGVGIFRHEGDNAKVHGGLTEPDPREPQGAVSLCQGVGVGPRAHGGGGIGLCFLRGNGISALASYFGQGAGYWHGAGAFRLRGAGATIQGRRYTLGSGVHSAFGHFEAFGNGNRILNWGVGPAYGWDRGVGSAIVIGDDVEVQADWGAGAANVGGRSFAYYAGRNGRLKIADAGTGQFFRNESAYSIQIVSGTAQRVEGFGALGGASDQRLMRNAWGVVRFSSATLVADLGLTKPSWPAVERAAALDRQTVDLKKALSDTQAQTSSDAVAALADVAAAFSLDKDTPRVALKRLLSLPADQAPQLVSALDPAAVDASIPLTIAIAARGSALTGDLYRVKSPDKAPLATQLLRYSRPSTALPLLLTRAAGKEPVWSAAAIRAIGAVMNRDTGEEPGTRALLESVQNALKKGGKPDRALSLLRRIRFIEAMGLLATCASIGPGERLELLDAGPEDLTDRLGSPGAGKFMDIVARDAAGNRDRIGKELAAMEKAHGPIRKLLEKSGKSKNELVAKAATIAAGGLGKLKGTGWIESLLTDGRPGLKEAAAVALGRLGEEGLPALRKATRSSTPRLRALAAFAAGHATSSSDKSLLETSLSDSSGVVVMTAAAVLRNLPEALYGARDDLKKKAARRLNETTSRETKLQLKFLP